jgi:uncharacterized protein (DUF1778 family)
VEQVLGEHSLVTTVPVGFFDGLLTALDEPARPNEALRAAARRARGDHVLDRAGQTDHSADGVPEDPDA